MFFPVLVILPGMIAIALTYKSGSSGFMLPKKPDGTFEYNMAIPLMLGHYFPTGMLGVGLTALMASFMSELYLKDFTLKNSSFVALAIESF